MPFNIDITKTPYGKIISTSVILFAAIVAPVWHIFYFFPVVFKSIELFKLILLAASVGFPVILFNAILLSSIVTVKTNRMLYQNSGRDFSLNILFVASLPAVFCFYTPYFIQYVPLFRQLDSVRLAAIADIAFLIAFGLPFLSKSKKETAKQESVDSPSVAAE